MSSYRLELGGILAALYIISRVCEYYNIDLGETTLFCDNKGAITKSFRPSPGITPFLTTDYDLLFLIHKTVQALPITIIGQWVKGHYTGSKRELQHDLYEVADDLATTQLNTSPPAFTPHRLPLAHPGYKIRALHDNSTLMSQWYTILAKQKHDNNLKAYIMKKTNTNWSEQQFKRVDWDANQRAFRHQTRHQQVHTAKIVHNLSNTNRQNHLMYQADPLCPLCQAHEETFEHVLQCPAKEASTYRVEQLTLFETTLKQLGTPLIIIQSIMQGFHHWLTPPGTHSRAPTYGSVF